MLPVYTVRHVGQRAELCGISLKLLNNNQNKNIISKLNEQLHFFRRKSQRIWKAEVFLHVLQHTGPKTILFYFFFVAAGVGVRGRTACKVQQKACGGTFAKSGFDNAWRKRLYIVFA